MSSVYLSETPLAGLTIHDFDEGETVVGAFILLKVLDAEGDVTWSFRNSESSPNREVVWCAVRAGRDAQALAGG